MGAPDTTINLAQHFDDADVSGTLVRLSTTQGNVDLEMFDVAVQGRSAAPQSVANFLNYVNNGSYDGTIYHRSIPGFVVQGGGFRPDGSDISAAGTPTVPNEFNPDRSNLRGTVAYAKLDGDPDSATTEYFFNLGNNSQNLDTQNGGFTVFGRVLDQSLPVVDAIAALPTTDATEVNLAFSDLPVRNPVPDEAAPAADDFVVVNDASVVPEISYAVTGDNPAVVTPVLEGSTLVLNYGDVPGTATVTVTATGVGGETVADSFQVNVLSGSEVIVNVGTAAGAARQLSFSDADGTNVTVQYRGSSAAVRLVGSGLTQDADRRGVTVSGTGIDIGSIAVSGSTARDTLTIRGRGGNGRVNVGSIAIDGPLRAVTASEAALAGGLTASASVTRVDLLRTDGGTISIGGNGPVTLNAQSLVDTDVIVGGELRSLRIDAFSNTSGAPRRISAPAVGTLTVGNDFQGNLTVADAIRSARVGGGVGGGTWSAASAGRLNVGSITDGWVGNFTGNVARLSVSGDMGGRLVAATVNNVSVRGNLRTAAITTTGTGTGVGRLTVNGTMDRTLVRSSADVGNVTAGAITDSQIYAGIDVADPQSAEPVALPESAVAFTREATIRNVTVRSRGAGHTFVRSQIAATNLGRLNLGTVDPVGTAGPAGAPGVAGDRIASLTGTVGTATTLRLARLDDPAAAQAAINNLGELGNFVIRVV